MTRGAGRLGPAPELPIGVRRGWGPQEGGPSSCRCRRHRSRGGLGPCSGYPWWSAVLGCFTDPLPPPAAQSSEGIEIGVPHDRLTPAPAGGGRSPSGGNSRAPRRSFPPSDPGQEADERRARAPATCPPRPRLMSDDRRLEELEADARHASERYRLYRAKVNGPRPTSTGRLRELERESERAQRTLARARETQAAG